MFNLKEIIGIGQGGQGDEAKEEDGVKTPVAHDSLTQLPYTADFAVDRHLIEYEIRSLSTRFEELGLDLSITLTANSALAWALLHQLANLSLGFSPIIYLVASVAINAGSSIPYLGRPGTTGKYVAGLTIAKLLLSSVITGSLINAIDNQRKEDIASRDYLIEVANNYNRGFPSPQPTSDNAGIFFIAIAGITFFISIIRVGLLGRKD